MKIVISFCVVAMAAGDVAWGWMPGTGTPNAEQGFVVDRQNRRDVLAFYQCVYRASGNYSANMNWTGTVATGVAGTTSAAFKGDVRRRINFYRALAGLPADIVLDSTKSQKNQLGAMMMSANNAMSHTPPTSWIHYSVSGTEALRNSNIVLGAYGPPAVDLYMSEPGSANTPVGHRRWLQYSRAQEMGTGDIPPTGFASSNSIWVIGNFKAAPVPQFVAWPNAGFMPHVLISPRWSLSYPEANFTSATVTMTRGGNPVALNVVSRTDNGFGDNTIVWEPAGLPAQVTADVAYQVTVSGITGSGIPTSTSYGVTLFNPNDLGETVTVSGTASPPAAGALYTYNGIAQADSYELQVSRSDNSAWLEGAEDTPAPKIQSVTTGTYALRHTAVIRTGAKAFHLTFPDFTNQSFEILRDILPGSTSQLIFYDRFRFVTNDSRLSAEISTNGLDWTEVWGRNGVTGTDTPSFEARSISLAAYQGIPIRVRFIFRHNNFAYTGGADNLGVYLDDISVSNAVQLTNFHTTALPGSASGFTFNSATAGTTLLPNSAFFLRVRPNVGTQWFGYGPLKPVTIRPPTGYETWLATSYPALNPNPHGDQDNDSIPLQVEYAFQLNPTLFNSPSSLPRPEPVGTNYVLAYTAPAGVTGITYGAQWSIDLVHWTDLTDTGTGLNHRFSISTVGRPVLFIRHLIKSSP